MHSDDIYLQVTGIEQIGTSQEDHRAGSKAEPGGTEKGQSLPAFSLVVPSVLKQTPLLTGLTSHLL